MFRNGPGGRVTFSYCRFMRTNQPCHGLKYLSFQFILMDDIELGLAFSAAGRSVAVYMGMRGDEQDFETKKTTTADSLIYLKQCINSLNERNQNQKKLKHDYIEKFKSLMKRVKEKDDMLLKEYEDIETVGTIVEIS